MPVAPCFFELKRRLKSRLFPKVLAGSDAACPRLVSPSCPTDRRSHCALRNPAQGIREPRKDRLCSTGCPDNTTIVDHQQRFRRGQSNVHDASMDERTRSMTRTITARPFLKISALISKKTPPEMAPDHVHQGQPRDWLRCRCHGGGVGRRRCSMSGQFLRRFAFDDLGSSRRDFIRHRNDRQSSGNYCRQWTGSDLYKIKCRSHGLWGSHDSAWWPSRRQTGVEDHALG
jgi:hypothetical protein